MPAGQVLPVAEWAFFCSRHHHRETGGFSSSSGRRQSHDRTLQGISSAVDGPQFICDCGPEALTLFTVVTDDQFAGYGQKQSSKATMYIYI